MEDSISPSPCPHPTQLGHKTLHSVHLGGCEAAKEHGRVDELSQSTKAFPSLCSTLLTPQGLAQLGPRMGISTEEEARALSQVQIPLHTSHILTHTFSNPFPLLRSVLLYHIHTTHTHLHTHKHTCHQDSKYPL